MEYQVTIELGVEVSEVALVIARVAGGCGGCGRVGLRHWLIADGGGSVTEALAAAHRLLEECAPLLAAAGAAADTPIAPREITACVYHLVAEHGLQQVRAAQRSVGEPHAALNNIFHDVVQWKVKGYDA